MAASLPDLFRFWWTFKAPVSPRAYRMHGAALVLVKYAGDAALVMLGTGRLWIPFDYLNSVAGVSGDFQTAPVWLMPALLLWMLPFLWAGISLTLRRVVDADWSPWWSMCFFVPFLNYALMLRSAWRRAKSRARDPRLG